ncbi:MAG: hypothetical protein OXU75_05050 [Deltaproteobacteria bacterium]|nr:hypothetical protein [Deltaproteobacteria bacterium]
MLKSKIAMILAAAMVLATLYGCSSGVSDSTHDRVKEQVTELQGTIDAIGAALGLPAGSTQAAILAALTTATADQLAAIRTQLELADDADSAAIVAAIMGLQVEPSPPAFVDQSGLPDDVMKMAGSADIAAGGSATIGEVMYSCAAGGEDCTVMVNEDGAAVSTGGTVTAAIAPAYTTRKANEAEAERIAMETAATTRAALTKETAITAERGQTTDAGLGGSAVTATGNAEGAYNVVIDPDEMTVMVRVEGATDDDDENFMLAMDMMDGRTMHTRTQDADSDGNVVQETVIVATDLEAPEAVAFDKFKVVAADGTETTPYMLNARGDGVTVDADNPADGITVVDAHLTSTAADPGVLKADRFKAPDGTVGTVTLPFQQPVEDDDTTPDVDESRDAAQVMGTLNGAMGAFHCTGAAACTVTTNAKGEVTAVSANNWVFVPAEGATSDQPDYDYLNYGFWLQKTTDKDGVVTYDEVETFQGSRLNGSGSVASVTGSAKYEGGAVGVYVHKTFAEDGTSNATSGHFKADASLTATFGQVNDDNGQGTIAPNMLNRLEGTINKFVLSGGETQGWSVSLSGAIDTGAGTAASAADSNTPFSATFYGSTGADNTTKPSSVAGEFNAGFSNGSVAGAFGAGMVEDE